MENNELSISAKTFQNGENLPAQTPPKQAVPPKKGSDVVAQNLPVRRVGSFTLGVCLITAGILLLCYYFLPNFDLQLALKVAPAGGLILLGSEILVFAAKPERRRYDFLSVFICLILMAGCFLLTLLPLVFDDFNPENQKVAKNLSDEYQQHVYQMVHEEAPDIRLEDMDCEVELYHYNVEGKKLTADNTKMIELNFWLQGPYDTAEAFAKDCRRLTDVVQKMDLQPNQVGFYCKGFTDADGELSSASLVQKANYELHLNGEVQLDWTAAEMEQDTDVYSLIDEENAESEVREEADRSMNEAENSAYEDAADSESESAS